MEPLAGGLDGEIHLAMGTPAAPDVVGARYFSWTYDAGVCVLVYGPRNYAAVHATERLVAEHGRVDPTHSEAARA